jgi:formate-dependent nitrite reductase cytochrome c552 subunit
MAHGEIVLHHGSQARPLSCYTCHNKEVRDFLVTEQGTKIDMDHSYQMCGQCHFRQKKDWVGGAHGKRISYWAGKRVVKNCASCHDPHSPRFKKRWPVIYSPPLSKRK